MAGTLGRLQPSQYYQASGEATPQAKLPEQYQSFNQPTSSIGSAQMMPYENWHCITAMSYVDRHERMAGIRTLYQRGMTRMPIRRDGADGTPRPWNSAANRNNMGPIRNGHFNDAHFQAGYPGYNLGISFKVQNIHDLAQPSQVRSMQNTPANINVANQPTVVVRAVQGIKNRWGRSAGSK